MSDLIIIWDWLMFALRWLHVVTAMAWIGTSFYFIALDLGLRRMENPSNQADGEEWQVHGGGFYHVQKYLVAPQKLPKHLVWFKWESYTTWLSGAALLMLMYWAGAELYLIDRSKIELNLTSAILISAGSLAIGWLLYDFLCKSSLRYYPNALMVLLFIFLMVMAWGYNQVFSGRAALLHLGSLTATIMTGNVFFVIMPNQRIVVNDLMNRRTPKAEYGRIAKLRSTHNNYLTLPVIFLMLSNHYPLAFASQYNWLIAGLVFLIGVNIRYYFNTLNSRKGPKNWTWLFTAGLFILIMWLSTTGLRVSDTDTQYMTEKDKLFGSADGFEDVYEIVNIHCSMCHSRMPTYQGIYYAPNQVYLETPQDVMSQAKVIFLQSAITEAMPPGNLTGMQRFERDEIKEWYILAESHRPVLSRLNKFFSD